MKFTLIFIFLFASYLYSAELTPDIIARAKRISIIKGTFDPLTNGHISMGERIINEGISDIVIYLPTVNTPHKNPLPYIARSTMIEVALKNNENLHYLAAGESRISDSDLIKKIRSLNDKSVIQAVIGTDQSSKNISYLILKTMLDPDEYIISQRTGVTDDISSWYPKDKLHFLPDENIEVSSSMVRKYLVENKQLYFQNMKHSVVRENETLLKYMPEALTQYIFDNGIYLNKSADNSSTLVKKTFQSMQKVVAKVGLFDVIRDQIVKKYKANAPRSLSIEVAGQTYFLDKYIGSGLQANTYIIEMNEQKYIIKIANERLKSTEGILNSIPVQFWAKHKTKLNVPEVLMFSAKGEWAIFEYIEGETLKDYMVKNNDVLSSKMKKQMDEIIKEANLLYKSSYMKLDLNYDNFIIRDSIPYLVDLGTIPEHGYMPANFDEAYKAWTGKFSFRETCSNFFKKLGSLFMKDLPSPI